MEKKLFVVLLFAVVFQSSVLGISVTEDTPSIKPKCLTPNCPGCTICNPKPICEAPICPAVECRFGYTPQPTVLPNGCPGCRKCVRCVLKPCPAMACINLTSTTLPNGCPGCPTCGRSVID